MSAKEYLMQIKYYDKLINNKLTELYQLNVLSTSVSIAVGSEKVQSSPKHDKIEKSVIKILEKREEIDKLVDFFVDKKSEIIKMMEGLDNTVYYDILFKRYVENKKWESIASDIGYDIRHATRLHGKALSAFEKKYKKQIEMFLISENAS